MYAACFLVEIDQQGIQKIEQMLREKWKVEIVILREYEEDHWIVSFLTKDNGKAFNFSQIAGNLGGRVLKYAIN